MKFEAYQEISNRGVLFHQGIAGFAVLVFLGFVFFLPTHPGLGFGVTVAILIGWLVVKSILTRRWQPFPFFYGLGLTITRKRGVERNYTYKAKLAGYIALVILPFVVLLSFLIVSLAMVLLHHWKVWPFLTTVSLVQVWGIFIAVPIIRSKGWKCFTVGRKILALLEWYKPSV